MSERKDEKWLDQQLRQAVNGTAPAFDAEAWKQKHRDEYQALLARRKGPVGWGLPHRFRVSRRFTELGRWIGTLAVAAAIVLGVGLLMQPEHRGTPVPPPPRAADPAARMMSMMSLTMAYQRGGFDALDQQLHNSLDEFGPRSSGVSMQELF